MGSPNSESKRGADENQHRVEITKSLYFSKHEVTIGQFRQFVNSKGYRTEAEKTGLGGYRLNPIEGDIKTFAGATWRNPGYPVSDAHPVSQVTWDDANAFAVWLGKKEGKKYRLPTEAEWEYAARAGTTTRFSTGDQFMSLRGFANLSDLSAMRSMNITDPKNFASIDDGSPYAARVGTYQPNQFGLYDMHGNLWEWCYDTYDPNFYLNSKTKDPFSGNAGNRRILRGGCYI